MLNQKFVYWLSWITIGFFSVCIIGTLFHYLEKINNDTTEINTSIPKPLHIFKMIISPAKVIDSASIHVDTVYSTNDDFMVNNTINYDTAIVTNTLNSTYFSEVIGVNMTALSYDPSSITQSNVDNFVNDIKNFSNKIGRNQLLNNITNVGDGNYEAVGTITPFFEGDQNTLFLFFSGNHIYQGYYQPIPLSVSSALPKLQAETNRDLQKEIAQNTVNNDIVTELTLVIVFAVPLGLAVEYRIEHHIYQLEKIDSRENCSKRSSSDIHSKSPESPRE
ncbi:MAG: hypothetical protein KGI33_04165 [Thaumarchaeota archaeon]|nr:hypothetical protein [Nitrososphaerota archaeon]